MKHKIDLHNVLLHAMFVVFQSKPKNELVNGCASFVYFPLVFPLSMYVFFFPSRLLSLSVCVALESMSERNERSCLNLIALQCLTHPLGLKRIKCDRICVKNNENYEYRKQFNPFERECFCLLSMPPSTPMSLVLTHTIEIHVCFWHRRNNKCTTNGFPFFRLFSVNHSKTVWLWNEQTLNGSTEMVRNAIEYSKWTNRCFKFQNWWFTIHKLCILISFLGRRCDNRAI